MNYVGSLLIAMRRFYFDEKSPDKYVFVDSLGGLLNGAVRSASGFEGLAEEEAKDHQQEAEIVHETDFEEEESDEGDETDTESSKPELCF